MKTELSEFAVDLAGPRVLCQTVGDATLYLGLEDGRLAHCAKNTLSARARDSLVVQKTGHGGAITCLQFVAECGGTDNASRTHKLLFTGSADRSIKIWANKPRGLELECIQTLVGHGGTITALEFGGGFHAQRLISCSTDRTIRVWSTVPNRELLLHPWFDTCQVIKRKEWITSAVVGPARSETEAPTIYAGDSTGGVLVVVPNPKRPSATSPVRKSSTLSSLARARQASASALGASTDATLGVSETYDVDAVERYHVHDLGIFAMVMLKELNLVVTAGYDNCVRVFDAVGRAAFLCIRNERRCRYTAVSWDSVHHELLCGDQLGFLEVWNIYTDKRLMCHRIAGDTNGVADNVTAAITAAASATSRESKRSEETKAVSAYASKDLEHSREAILTCTVFSDGTPGFFSAAIGSTLHTWTMLRDLEYEEHAGHSDAIVSLVCFDESPTAELEPSAATMQTTRRPSTSSVDSFSEKAKHGFQLFSASLDNTLRAWDWYDMRCLFKLREPQSEMTCLTRVPDSGILATGNEDGTIRMWSCDTGSTMVLRGHENTVLCLDIAERRRHVYLLSAGYDGKVGIWDVTLRSMIKPKLECMFEAHKPHAPAAGVSGEADPLAILQQDRNQEILCIRYNPAGAFPEVASTGQQRPDSFLTAGNDCVVRVWQFTSYTLLCALEGHTEPVTCLEVDAYFAISGSDDGSIRVWNLANLREGFEIARFQAHQASVRDMAVLSGRSGPANLVTCSFDGAIRVWDYIGGSGGVPKSTEDEDSETKAGPNDDGSPRLLKEFRNAELQFRTLAICERHDLIVAGTQQGRLVTHSIRKLSQHEAEDSFV